MFEVVLGNLWHQSISKVIFVSPKGTLKEDKVSLLTKRLKVPIRNFEIDHLTDGPASSVGLVRHLLDPKMPLVIANSDQYIDADLSPFFERLSQNAGHLILTMEANDNRWSFVELDSTGRVITVREKEVISACATVGIYGFVTAADFFYGLEKMRVVDDRTNGELYVAPVFNYLMADKAIYTVHLGKLGEIMHGLGTPDDYEKFVSEGPLVSCLQNTRRHLG